MGTDYWQKQPLTHGAIDAQANRDDHLPVSFSAEIQRPQRQQQHRDGSMTLCSVSNGVAAMEFSRLNRAQVSGASYTGACGSINWIDRPDPEFITQWWFLKQCPVRGLQRKTTVLPVNLGI